VWPGYGGADHGRACKKLIAQPRRKALFDLAVTLHWPSVAWGEKVLGCAEFDEWLAYFKLEPFEPRRQDWRNALLAQTISNVFLAAIGATGRSEIKDFLPVLFPDNVPENSTDNVPYQHLLAKLEMLTAAYGGQDLRIPDGNDDQPGDAAG